MARSKSVNREKAFEIYENANGSITPKEIAERLGENVANIRTWKSLDKWDITLGYKTNKKGAPKGNQNAIGNNGGAPTKNNNRYKHGFYSKYLPKQTYDIFEQIESMDPIEILWNNIKIKYAAIIRAQKIMYVKSKGDITKELKRTKDSWGDKSSAEEREWELQFAWDKQANFLKAQSDAMRTLTKMIKEYDTLVNCNPLATEEQKLRIEMLKTKLGKGSNGIDNVQIVDDIDE